MVESIEGVLEEEEVEEEETEETAVVEDDEVSSSSPSSSTGSVSDAENAHDSIVAGPAMVMICPKAVREEME